MADQSFYAKQLDWDDPVTEGLTLGGHLDSKSEHATAFGKQGACLNTMSNPLKSRSRPKTCQPPGLL